ncbi:MAG: hypothetical protein NT045_09470, partial [Candidatus Aureabacteria bacterium]|nr:hypothetical protein [Candidatus Auribacterota bacterium]
MRRILFPLCVLCLFPFRSLAADGDLVWAKRAGGTDWDEGCGIASLADGSVLVTGWFSGTATFGSDTLTSAGDRDMFIARYNPDGTL